MSQCLYRLSVDRARKGHRGRVELLDPLGDRDLLEGVAPLGSWDSGDSRYVEAGRLGY